LNLYGFIAPITLTIGFLANTVTLVRVTERNKSTRSRRIFLWLQGKFVGAYRGMCRNLTAKQITAPQKVQFLRWTASRGRCGGRLARRTARDLRAVTWRFFRNRLDFDFLPLQQQIETCFLVVSFTSNSG
jgi:hypothetical protein